MSPASLATIVRRPSALALPLALALAVAACQGEAPTQAAGGHQLVTDAAVSAIVGPDGGELTTADPERGRTYRLSIPAGAFAEDTQVTASPIATIDGFPLDGDLLGGLELKPDGAVFLAPVTLEISIDADRQAELRTALDNGEAVVGFSYPGGTASVADDLAITLADVADDLSSVRLTLFHFSGRGAGTGSPQNLGNLPGPQDPAAVAQIAITQILHPPGGPADPADPAVRGQIANVLRNWLDAVEFELDLSVNNPEAWGSALAEALDWHTVASRYGFLTKAWYASGDELSFEGAILEAAVFRSYSAALDEANRDCLLGQGPLDDLLTLINFHDFATNLGLYPLPPLSGLGALGPSNFCLQFTIKARAPLPIELDEGDSDFIELELEVAPAGIAGLAELTTLLVVGTATPQDPLALTVHSVKFLGTEFVVDVTALKGIPASNNLFVPGSESEGTFTISVEMLGMAGYASLTVPVDIKAAPRPPIECSGDPTTVTYSGDERIGIQFNGSACALVPGLSDDDDPDVALVLNTDEGLAGWHAGTGSNWERETLGDNEPPGTRSVRINRRGSGATFTLTFTVEVTLINGGDDVRLTVRDVTITPVVDR